MPEARASYLGPVRGRRILEVGCGAGRWSLGLRQRGARPVGLDLSRVQLRKARAEAGSRPLPLLRGNAEALPFKDGSFDIAFCDWGALTFGDPRRTIPECARVLRPGGRLVFATASPLRYIAYDRQKDRQTRALTAPYFRMNRQDWGDTVEFQMPYGEWIDLFVRSGFAIERLVETRPAPGSRSRYLRAPDNRWARSWPMEAIWVLSRAPATGRDRAKRPG